MKKFAIPLIISLMTLALAGLLGIQVYWVASAIKLKEQEFTDDVNNALFNVSEHYALNYQQHIIDTLLNGMFTPNPVPPLPARNEIVIVQEANRPKAGHHQVIVSEGEEVEQVIIQQKQSQNVVWQEETEVTAIANAQENEVRIIQKGVQGNNAVQIRINNDGDNLHEEIEFQLGTEGFSLDQTKQYYQSKSEAAMAASKAATEQLDQVMIDFEGITQQAEDFTNFILRWKMHKSQLDSVLLDSMLKTEMVHHRFPEEFDYKVASGSVHHPFPSPEEIFPEATTPVYHIRLKTHNRFGPGPILYLNFPGQQSHLLKNMGWALSFSGLLMLVIVGCFAYAITAFRKQKKLSDLKTDFINNMSHELKTPISTISLASEALSDPDLIGETTRIRHFAGIIFDENQRLKQQVERVLQMGRMDKGELKLNKSDFDLHDVIRKEVDRITPAMEARQGSLEMELEAGHTHLFADQVHFSGIIQNLLDNAIKYSPETPKIKVSTAVRGKELILSVADKGIGMSKEVQKRVFDKFYRAQTGNRHDVKGFGLGLSYISLMTEAHGGEINLKSEPGKGSEFTLTFPV